MLNGLNQGKQEGWTGHTAMPADVRPKGTIESELNELFLSLERLDSIAGQFESVIVNRVAEPAEAKEYPMSHIAVRIKNASDKVNVIADYLMNHQL